jgi:exodeoxyribonuclease VII large subunit
MNQSALSLFKLMEMAKASIKGAFQDNYWVLAEISEVKVNYSGHCYLELIEKEEGSDSIKARVRATIWAATYRMLRPYFETAANVKFQPGIKILIRVSVEFHEVYGFSLNITDIEPSYTIGEAARQKQEIIKRLIADGVYEMNRKLQMPVLPKRIAVISSAAAAGYGDFIDQLKKNPYGYKFSVKLFPAVMQGEGTEQSVIRAFEKVFACGDLFDIAVVIRGGGAQSELACFNSYWIAYHICQFPIPVLTGIGHEQDETIADLVAHTKLKTPTAVAEYLISLFREADENLGEAISGLYDAIKARINTEKNVLEKNLIALRPLLREKLLKQSALIHEISMNITDASNRLLSSLKLRISFKTGMLRTYAGKLVMQQKYYCEELRGNLIYFSRVKIEKEKHKLDLHGRKNEYLDPFRILERGYSVTYNSGKAIKTDEGLPEGTVLETRLYRGMIKSKKI